MGLSGGRPSLGTALHDNNGADLALTFPLQRARVAAAGCGSALSLAAVTLSQTRETSTLLACAPGWAGRATTCLTCCGGRASVSPWVGLRLQGKMALEALYGRTMY